MHRRRMGRQLGRMLMLALAGMATAACTAKPAASAAAAEMVEGVPLAEWTARWWRWADDQSVAPYLDPDGRYCQLGQSGPVWFLAGTNGEFQPRRECVVPEGKHLLVPVINMISYGIYEGDTCGSLQDDAAVNNDHLLSAVVVLDGQPVGDVRERRVTSAGCFRMDPDDDSSTLAAADGYWLLIKPLPRGRHTLSVGANYDTRQGGAYSGMQQTFDYVLHVGGRDHMAASEPVASPVDGTRTP